jgi:cell division protein FtsW
MVYSATSASATLGGSSATVYLARQAVYAALGLVGMIALSRFSYRLLRPLAPTLLMAALGLCLAVLVGGVAVNGARRWFVLGPISVQPSELAKLALALWVPACLARRGRPRTLGELVRPIGLMVGIAAGLIVIEPDLGTVVVIALMVSAALTVAGTPLPLLARMGACAGALALAAIWFQPYRRERMLAFLNPWADVQAAGYQTAQSLTSFGSGGIFGHGLGEGVQKIHYLPEAHTDMIAAVVGEELGLIGVSLLIVTFAVFAWAGLRIALSCRDPFGKMLATSLTAMIAGQAAINLAAVLGLLPLTGITLPFVSYGGSSLVVSLLAVGILLNIASSHDRESPTEMSDRRRRNGRAPAARAGCR